MSLPKSSNFHLLNSTAFDTISTTFPADKPIFMLNVLRFKDTATYPADAPDSFKKLEKVSGKECYYSRYIPAIQNDMFPPDSQFLFVGAVVGNLLASIAEGQNKSSGIEDGRFAESAGSAAEDVKGRSWDTMALVRYPSFQVYRDFVESKEYREKAMPHRVASVEEYVLVACEETSLEALNPKL